MPTIDENTISTHDHEQSHWHAFSLVFVALPAVAGLVFENGSAVMTDLLLLGLGCLFLYWSVKWPFQWYHSAQQKLYLIEDDYDEEEEIFGEDVEDIEEAAEKPTSTEETFEKKWAKISNKQSRRNAAVGNLRSMELMALAACFVSPIAVAYLLHAIRPYLSRPSGGLVSNSNLTLFVLAAEVRPVLHVLRLIEARTLHLQRLVTELPPTLSAPSGASDQISDLLQRIIDLEASRCIPKDTASSDNLNEQPEASTTGQQQIDPSAIAAAAIKVTIQPQLDALNRAVRRYEKRSTTQAVVLEARLHELDSRVNDALSLAAAASRLAQQRPVGLITWIATSVNQIVSGISTAVWGLVTAPWRLTSALYAYLRGSVRSGSMAGQAGKPGGVKKTISSSGVLGRGKGAEKSPIGSGGVQGLMSPTRGNKFFGKESYVRLE
jgi:hypothetical protein